MKMMILKTNTSRVDATVAKVKEAVDDESAGYPITALGEIKEVFREV